MTKCTDGPRRNKTCGTFIVNNVMTSSTEIDEHIVSSLDTPMRELDADILEQGIGTSSSFVSPLITSLSDDNNNTNIDDLPMLLPPSSNRCFIRSDEINMNSFNGNNFYRNNTAQDTTERNACRFSRSQRDADPTLPCLNAIKELQPSTCITSDYSRKENAWEKTSAIQKIEEQKELRNGTTNTTKQYVCCKRSSSGGFFSTDICPTLLFDVEKSESVESSDKMKCSPLHSRLSVERRLNEAAQFAEAVGEIPPMHEGEISQLIVEEYTDDDDDDDDETEEEEMALDDNGETKEEIDDDDETEEEIDDDERNDTDVDLTEKENGDMHKLEKETCPEMPEQRAVGTVPQQNKISVMSISQQGIIPAIPDSEICSSTAQKAAPTASVLHAPATQNLEQRVEVGERITSPKTIIDQSVISLLGGLPPSGCIEEERSKAQFTYRGLLANPPEITKQGMARGNYAQLHRKAWLEVSDKYHRYGKNLRLYYKHWESLGHPTNMFFDWLDSHGEAAGDPLPNIPECPRSKLDSDTVRYVTNTNFTQRYALKLNLNHEGCMRIYDVNDNVVCTGEDGWIFVLRDGIMYAAPKITSINGKSKQRFHHSSFFGGKAVAGAGIIVTQNNGQLARLYPHSGHYRPGEAHMQRVLFFLQRNGIELSCFQVDTQQIFHVSRKEIVVKEKPKRDNPNEKEMLKRERNEVLRKAKKVDSLHLVPATHVASFLAHKAMLIREGVFEHIHNIRRVKAAAMSSLVKRSTSAGS